MMKIRTMTWVAAAVAGLTAFPAAVEAQRLATDDPVLQGIWDEGMNNSQFEALSQVLLDEIGPRLTASPGIEAAQRWAVETMRRASEVAESSARAAAADHAADVRREALAADLSRSVADEIRRRFLAGVDAVKHGRAGAPKKKRIFLDPRTDELYWLAPGAPPNPAKAAKRFAVATAVSVRRGKATPVFARKAAAAAPPATCLSLVNGGGDGDRDSLDLQFASKQDRDALASGLETLIARLGE